MLSRYDIFCKVVELGSFTRAAEALGYSQSAVSQTVKALEEELGTALVSRGRATCPTCGPSAGRRRPWSGSGGRCRGWRTG